ncbi:MAG: phosphoglycerate kinase [Candidatus Eisenbacteria bacterium]|uniref:Phosphoglycerate kinase n=1 Tax=Eiseniibacteriota bacterium TaxID=2212470 RepID=A0A538TUI2_UNCEI|nr:MAG: phosphoglycerate kinase [Candidatus Eisenbacteria bacterium]
MSFRRLNELEVSGRRVFVRVDFNVPLGPKGEVSDDSRIVASLPTIRYLIGKGARLVLASHLGRPKGKVDPKQSLRPVRDLLEKFLRAPVAFSEAIVGPSAEAASRALSDGGVLLLENLRFDPREEANDPELSRALAALADAYVDDAFGAAHRAHASIAGMTSYLSDCAAGFLLEQELKALGKLLAGPEHPYVAILGGAKISGKIDVLRNLLPRVDRVVIGGGMMFTFLRARGLATGRSLVEADRIPLAKEILDDSSQARKILLPSDCVAAEDISGADPGRVVPVTAIPEDRAGVDIGPESLASIADALAEARTIFWNGPMGVFEVPRYAEGTMRVAVEVAKATKRGAFTVVGGGDSLAAVKRAGVDGQISHCSTGGGASLEFLEGKTLPGVAALEASAKARAR